MTKFHAEATVAGTAAARVPGDEAVAEAGRGRETWVDAALPWFSSTLLHAGIGLVLGFVGVAVSHSISSADAGSAIVIPQGGPGITDEPWKKMGEGQGVSGVGQTDLSAMQNLVETKSAGWDIHGRENSKAQSVAGMSGEGGALDVIGFSSQSAGRKGLRDGLFGGDGEPGLIAQFGATNRLGGNLFGVGDTPGGGGQPAKKIVYVLDHSGSMLENFDYLRSEVKYRVGQLKPIQQFGVVVFSENAKALGTGKLQRALPDAQRTMGVALDEVVPQGKNDEMLEPFQGALEKAFAMQPELIIFLTDGRFDSRLMEVVGRLNKEHKVAISTIAFVGTDMEYRRQLEEMAKANGGKYKFVSAEDLQKR